MKLRYPGFPFIIGITGKAGSGKDTFARLLRAALMQAAPRRAILQRGFADPVKDVCSDLFGFTELQLRGPSEERNKPDPRWDGGTPRRALQLCGTEFGRAFHPDTWVRKFLDDIRKHGMNAIVICADLRFDNEALAIRDAGGVVLSMMRDTGLAGDAAAHSSEVGIDPKLVNTFVDNRGPISDLEKYARGPVIQDFLTRAALKRKGT